MDKIIYNMATIPEREIALADAVKSILPQCDELNIYLNNWKKIPAFLNHIKINIFSSQKELGDLGDAGKFYCCENWNKAYVFTVDDKLIYPKDYTLKMIAKIEEYCRKTVISCHGRIIKKNCSSYYHDPLKQFNAVGKVPKDEFVHEIGTGVMALHTDTVKPGIKLDVFPYKNMSDILFGMEMQRRGVPMLIMAHAAYWIGINQKMDHEYSIHNIMNKKDGWITQYVNDFNWKIRKCKV
jgi:hypothetical protein